MRRGGRILVVRLGVAAVAAVFLSVDQARAGGFLSALERGVVQELNLARERPDLYADFLDQESRYYSGTTIRRPGAIPRATREGVGALREAVRFLRSQAPLPSMKASPGLCLAARDHVRDQGPVGAMGHRGTGGSTPWDRAERYGKWGGKIGENIAYGHDTAREVVAGLIIDDGVRGRGHRKNIFDPDFRMVGVSCGSHSAYRTVCVITFSGSFSEQDSP